MGRFNFSDSHHFTGSIHQNRQVNVKGSDLPTVWRSASTISAFGGAWILFFILLFCYNIKINKIHCLLRRLKPPQSHDRCQKSHQTPRNDRYIPFLSFPGWRWNTMPFWSTVMVVVGLWPLPMVQLESPR